MIVHSIPILETNYVYVVAWGSECVVIDPGESLPVLKFLEKHSLELKGILLTHKHGDHIGGVGGFFKRYQVPVYGGEDEQFPISVEKAVDVVRLLGVDIRVIKLPGHTEGGVGYLIGDCLFTGDVLFGAGCGFLFEGTVTQMVESLDKILVLNEQTNLYFGHEYTRRNLDFAKHMEPDNQSIVERLESLGKCTVPSTLGIEKQTNPFLRLDESVMIDRVNELAGKLVDSRVDRFALLRQWKTEFDSSD